jgi:hypothetical protein
MNVSGGSGDARRRNGVRCLHSGVMRTFWCAPDRSNQCSGSYPRGRRVSPPPGLVLQGARKVPAAPGAERTAAIPSGASLKPAVEENEYLARPCHAPGVAGLVPVGVLWYKGTMREERRSIGFSGLSCSETDEVIFFGPWPDCRASATSGHVGRKTGRSGNRTGFMPCSRTDAGRR